MRILDLSQPMRTGMPQSPNHPPFRMVLERRHGDMVRADGGSAANEVIITGGHVGTHVDALAHVSHDGKLFAGKPFAALTIDTFAPYVGRAVLLDVAAVHNVPTLPAGYEITVADLEAAAAHLPTAPNTANDLKGTPAPPPNAPGTPNDLRGTPAPPPIAPSTIGDLKGPAGPPPIAPGEVILIGTGWSRHWADPATFIGLRHGTPGPGAEAAAWLAAHRPLAVGGETIAFEHIPAGRGHALLPAHRILLVEYGINIVETMKLDALLDSGERDFTLVLNPLSVVGATGAPVRPLALLDGPAQP